MSIVILELEPLPEAIECFVACLDILGFKDALEMLGAAQLAAIYGMAIDEAQFEREGENTLFPLHVQTMDQAQELQELEKQGQEVGITHNKWYSHIKTVVNFSDSIFVFSTDQSPASLDSIGHYCNTIFRIYLRYGLALRGAIAPGDAVVDPAKELYVGTGIVSAYKLEESLDIVGVVLHEDVQVNSASEWRPVNIALKHGEHRLLQVPVSGREAYLEYPHQWSERFGAVRKRGGPALAQRYENSEEVVATMLGLNIADLRSPPEGYKSNEK